MSSKAKYVVACLCLLVLVAVALSLFKPIFFPGDKRPNLSSKSISRKEPAKQTQVKKAGSFSDKKLLASKKHAPQEAEATAQKPSGIPISGKVTDLVSGEPVKAFDFQLSRGKGRMGTTIVHEAVTNEEGRFSFLLSEGGLHSITIRSSCYLPKFLEDLQILESSGLPDLQIELDPGGTISGIVVEDGSNRPVPEAIVGVVGLTSLEQILLGHPEYSICAKTDKQGHFTLKGLNDKEHRLAAVHPDFAEVFVDTVPGEAWIEIRLKTGFRLFGKACDDEGTPRRGIVITLEGEKTPLPRPVLTGPDGKYLSVPVLPGWVVATASAPPKEKSESFSFTEESKLANITDKDVEVNFGPTLEHVTWKGTLYDHEGKSIPSAFVSIWLKNFNFPPGARMSDHMRTRMHSTTCDQKGLFTFCKLATGTYRVLLRIPPELGVINWGEITLAQPGVFEKDIILSRPGGVMRGVVIDETTGEPFNRMYKDEGTGRSFALRAFVRAEEQKTSQHVMVATDENGCFCLKGLPPGTYRVSATAGRTYANWWKSSTLQDLELEEGGILEGLQIKMTPQGMLLLKVIGIKDPEKENIRAIVKKEGGGTTSALLDFNLMRGIAETKSDGSKVMPWPLEPGLYSAVITAEGLSTIERSFEIFAGETTELNVFRDELEAYGGVITLSGSLKKSDGSPIAGAKLLFDGTLFMVPGLDKKNRVIEGTTDSKGEFILEGFKPGRWQARGTMPQGVEVAFPDLVIPQNPPNPFPLRLVLPGGTISGTLCSKESGFPLNESSVKWLIIVESSGIDASESREQKGVFYGQGPGFAIAGVPGGELRLSIRVDGYRNFWTEPFLISEGQNLDLGELFLEPTGILIVEIVDKNGNPIESGTVTFPGLDLPLFSVTSIDPGKCRCTNLPFGKVNATKSAKDFKEKEISVKLIPGKQEEVKVVLTPL